MLADDELRMGREALAANNAGDAMKHFMPGLNFHSRRWYVDAEFAIASNRATAAADLGHCGLARIDSRYTLAMKPDHVWTYERIPKILEAHCCRGSACSSTVSTRRAKRRPRTGRCCRGWEWRPSVCG
jgi:hypothetical protein